MDSEALVFLKSFFGSVLDLFKVTIPGTSISFFQLLVLLWALTTAIRCIGIFFGSGVTSDGSSSSGSSSASGSRSSKRGGS